MKLRKKTSYKFLSTILLVVFSVSAGCVKKVPEAKPRVLENVKKLGEEEREEGLAAKAIEEEKELIPTDPVGLFNLANKKRKLRKYKEAIALYRKAIEKEPGFVEAWINLAACYKKLGRLDDSLSALNQALIMAPDNPVPRVNRAILLRLRGDYDDAIRESLFVIRKYGNIESALLTLGFAYYESGKDKMGIYILRELTSRFPKNYIAHNLLGLIYERLGYLADAVDEFKTAISLKKNYYQALVNLARLELKLGRMDDAEEHIAKAVRARPRGGEGHLLRGIIMRKKGLLEEAEKEYKTALRYLKDRKPALYNLANLYQDYLGKPKLALEYLKQYAELLGKDAPPEHLKEVQKRIELLEKMTSAKMKPKEAVEQPPRGDVSGEKKTGEGNEGARP